MRDPVWRWILANRILFKEIQFNHRVNTFIGLTPSLDAQLIILLPNIRRYIIFSLFDPTRTNPRGISR